MEQKLYDGLCTAIGQSNIACEDFALYAVHADAGFEKGGMAEAVVRPQSTEHVASILRLANEFKTSVVVRGGASSAAAGATPARQGGILMDMTDMNRLIEVSPDTSSITAEAGITFGEMAAAVHPLGYTLCLGGHAIYTATLGGCIANTSVSIGSGFYGMFGEQVVNIKAVTPTGEIVSTGSDAMQAGGRFNRYCNGPDLAGLFIAGSGVLGIITEATLRLHPMPEERRYAVYCFDSLSRGTEASIKLEQAGVFDGQIAFGDHTLKVLRGPADSKSPIPENAQLIFRCSLAGDKTVVEHQLKKLDRIAMEHGGTCLGPDLAIPVTYDIMGTEFSKLRIFGVVAPIACTVPIRKIPELTELVETYLAEHADLILDIKGTSLKSWTNAGVVSKGGVISYAGRITFTEEPDKRQRAYEVWHALLEKMISMGGCPYWTGKTWTPHMVRGYRPEYLTFFRSLKRFMDPNSVLNPGLLLEELDKQ